jgi:hypothetical protein
VFTPLGFVHLFGVVGGVLVKPQFLQDLNEEYYVYSFEEETVRRRMNNAVSSGMKLVPFIKRPCDWASCISLHSCGGRMNNAVLSVVQSSAKICRYRFNRLKYVPKP